jgi:hypothetical protein
MDSLANLLEHVRHVTACTREGAGIDGQGRADDYQRSAELRRFDRLIDG